MDWATDLFADAGWGCAFHVAGNTGGHLDITKWVDPAGITEREGVVAGHRSLASLDITNSLRASRAGANYRTLRIGRCRNPALGSVAAIHRVRGRVMFHNVTFQPQ